MTSRSRPIALQVFLVVALTVFVTLAVRAHHTAYFPIDLQVSRALQSIDTPAFAALMRAVSWLGFFPQQIYLGVLLLLGLVLAGRRWEAATIVFGIVGSALVVLVKLVVQRPRPTPDLVHVLNQLNSKSFPSGHVMTFTTACGFLIYLAWTQLRPSAWRAALIAFLAAIIVLMGPSRIYLGHHWFSDVIGAYVLASLWLALMIGFYQRGARRRTGAAKSR